MTPDLRDAPFWHPFSQMSSARARRTVFARGEGCELIDTEGKRYLDATACLWYCAIGHGRREMAEAIAAQAERLAGCSCFDQFASDRTLELAEWLAGVVPLDNPVVFFTSGGSDAVDTAAKVTRRYWAELEQPEKQMIVSRDGAYHGTHAFGTSVAGIPANKEGFGQLIEDTATVPPLDPQALRSLLEQVGGERVAAFLAEPIMGAGGVHPASDMYLQEVRTICDEYKVLLVLDEVITGFGRTGHWFASQRYGVRPDILLTAKAITSGYIPLGAAVISERVAAPFWNADSKAWLRHGYTYSGHATACAAAQANIAIFEREGLVERAHQWEPLFAATVRALASSDGVEGVRTLGLVAGIQLDRERAAVDPGLTRRAEAECRKRGVLTRPLAGDTLLICPALVMEQPQLEQIVERMGEAIAAAARNTPVAA